MADRIPLVLVDGDYAQFPTGDVLLIDGGVTINDSGAAVHIRVETDNFTHALTTNGGADTVNIGTTVEGAIASFGGSAIVFNEAAGDIDFRVEGAASANLFVTDAGLNAVRIGQSSAGTLADFRSGSIVFNESGDDVDFRVESDGNANMFFVDGGDNRVGIGTATPGASSATAKLDVAGPITQSSTNSGVFIGNNAGAALTSGSSNVAIGNDAGKALTTGSSNVIVGPLAGDALTTGSFNFALGPGALGAAQTVIANFAIGSNALASLTSGSGNLAFGLTAGFSLISGSTNLFHGSAAGQSLSTGSANVNVGYQSSSNNQYGSYNTTVGFKADYAYGTKTGNRNTIVGAFAGLDTASFPTPTTNPSDNVLIGYQAGMGNTLSNVLIIENTSNITTPLIFGNFSTDLLDFNGAVTCNQGGADKDFRVEGDTLPYMLFVDASSDTENIALLTSAQPNWQSGDGILYWGNASAAPSGNPSSGVFVWAEGGELKARDGSGNVTTLTDPSTGDVVGPGSATDNAIARFDGTTGKLIQNSVGILSDTGVLTGIIEIDGGVVFNEPGADVDHRFEGDTATSLLVLDAGLDAVQIGTTTAGVIADFRTAAIVFNENAADRDFRVETISYTGAIFVDASENAIGFGGTGADFLYMSPTGSFFNLANNTRPVIMRGTTATNLFDVNNVANTVQIGTTTAGAIADFSASIIVINETGADQDLRAEGDTATSLFVLDAGLDAVQIGTTTAGNIFDARSSGIVINESGDDRDFRIEGDSLDYLFFIQGDSSLENMAVFASGAPNFQSGDRVLFWGSGTAPTGNPSSGAFLYTVNGVMATRTSGGHIAPLVGPPQIDIYVGTAGSHTWNKPTGAFRVDVHAVGGGGGGGSGRVNANGAVRGGGGGGGGGAYATDQFLAGSLGSSETVVVGAGGAAGARISATGDGAAGGAGGDTTFGTTLVVAGGGGAGGGGTNSAGGSGGAGGNDGSGNGEDGGAGGNGGAGLATPPTTAGSCAGKMAGGGGGGGDGLDTSNVGQGSGSQGGSSSGLGVTPGLFISTTAGLGAIGPQQSLPALVIVNASVVAELGGGGASGGASSGSATAGLTIQNFGKNGASYGGGGSGSGAANTTNVGFNLGGEGAPGVCIVITYFADVTLGGFGT